LGDNQELIYSPLTRVAHIASSFCTRLIRGCRRFATLDEHVWQLSQELKLGFDEQQAVRGQLRALINAGLLVSHSELAAYCHAASHSPANYPRIGSLGIPTRDRTDSLRRCLVSYIENQHGHQPELEFVIVDDSENADVRRANRQVLRTLKSRFGVEILYASPEEKVRFAGKLVEMGLPPEAAYFGLLNPERCPVTTGASRNALLLHGAGDVLLQVDDDTVCRPTPSPGAESGLSFTSQYDPTEFWLLLENGGAFPTEAPVNGDFRALHEQMLGKDLGDCISAIEADSDLDLDQAGAGFFRKLSVPGAKVLVTATGWAGASGMSSCDYFLSTSGATRSRLLGSEDDYRHALSGHQVVRAVTRRTVSEGTFCMAINLGLDNRDVLPPFMPVQRNQDGIFGASVRACFPGAFFGFLPWVVWHKPPAPRRFSPDDLGQGAVRVQSGQITQALINSFAPGPGKTDARNTMIALGTSLAEWGCAPGADFNELVRLLLWNLISRQACQLEAQLNEFKGQPDFWARDVRRLQAAWREALATREFGVPWDLREAFGMDPSAELYQRVVRKFGVLLQAWPDMIEAAKELRRRGQRLATKI
jgi:hypothetical protein